MNSSALAMALLLVAVSAGASVQTVVPGVAPQDYDSAGGLLVFVGDGVPSGLWTIDVTDPAAPSVLGSVETPGSSRGVKLLEGRALVADGFGGLTVVDVSVPTAPAVERTIPLQGNAAADVDVLGSIAYVAAVERFYVVDVSDTATAPILGVHVREQLAEGYTEVFVDPARPGQVVALYLATYVARGRTAIELKVFDVTTPAWPAPVGTLALGDADSDWQVKPVTLALVDGFAVVGFTEYGGGPRLSVIDVSVPTAPVTRDFIQLSTWRNEGIGSAAPGGLFWSASHMLHSVDLTDPDNILIVDDAPFDLFGPIEVVGLSVFQGLTSMDFLDTGEYGPDAVSVEELGADGPAWVVSPNPTRGATTLRWSRVTGAWTAVDVLDVAGRRVASLGSRWTGSGAHTLTWDGRDGDGRELAAGVYYLSITSGEERLVRKVVRLP